MISTKGSFKDIEEKIKKHFIKSLKKNMEKVGIQAINWIVNGSPNESVTPPILTGRLRGSGSIFVGDKLAMITPAVNGQGTPNTSHKDDDNVVTIGFNVPYAARWEEHPFNPGPVSEQAGNVGHKFVEKHVKADMKDYVKLLAEFMKKDFQ